MSLGPQQTVSSRRSRAAKIGGAVFDEPPFCFGVGSARVPASKRGLRFSRIVAAVSFLAILLFSAAWSAAAEFRAKESEIKAAYLFNFGIFTQWPLGKAESTNAPFVIGVMGNNTVATELDKIAAQARQIGGRKLVIHRLKPDADLSDCHILFIGSDVEFGPVLAGLKAAGKKAEGILTVGETEKFVERGGMINFVLVRENVKYEVNPSMAEKADLRVSAQLLRAALKIVTSDPGGNP